jgi:hypothetical protein
MQQINVDVMLMMLNLLYYLADHLMMVNEVMVHVHYLSLVLMMNIFVINVIFQDMHMLINLI